MEVTGMVEMISLCSESARQLSHVDQNAVRASYNRAEYLPERKEMMQQWADYLESLNDGNVVPIHQHS